MKDDLMVSVCCITYNHEKFIRSAVDSFLMQKTDFNFQIMIGDDASTDSTPKILNQYEEKYPGKIRLILRNKNIGANSNFIDTFQKCKGKYIAVCDGDDYWTDPLKLQKQVDFLENNPEFSTCFHEVMNKDEISGKEIYHKEYYKILQNKDVFDIRDIMEDNFIASCSVLFRNIIEEFPEWYSSLMFADWSLHILNARYGKIKYLPESMGIYRIHSGGMWSSNAVSNRFETLFDFYFLINKYFNYQYNDLIQSLVVKKIKVLVKDIDELEGAKKWLEKQVDNYVKALNEAEKKLSEAKKALWRIPAVIDRFFLLKSKMLAYLYAVVTKGKSKIISYVRIHGKQFPIIYEFLRNLYNFHETYKSRFKTITMNNQKWPEGKPLVSVVIPCFNYGKFIEEAIESVLDQTFQNVEIIVVDGGSTDEITHEILTRLEKPKTKIYFREGRHFVGDNRNFGITHAVGKYVCCLDADDILKPTYLEKCLFYLETYNCDGVYSAVQCFGASDEVWRAGQLSFENMIRIGNYVSTVAIFKKTLWEKFGKYKDWPIGEGHVPEDWEFWFRLIGNGAVFKAIDETLMLYRTHDKSLTAKCKTTKIEQENIIHEENSNLLSRENIARVNKIYSIKYRVNSPYINLFQEKKKKNILFALPFVIIGGADSILLRVANYLKRLDCNITIVTTVKTEKSFGDNSDQYSKITKEIYHLYDFIRETSNWKDFFFYLIETRQLDVLFIVGSEFVYRLLPEIRRRYPKLRIIDQLFNEFGHIKNNRKHAKEIDYNIIANTVIEDILVNRYNESKEKLKVIQHCVDTEGEFNPENVKAVNLQKLLRYDDNTTLIVSFFGRFSAEKGPDLFVKIALSLREYNIRFVMIGNGPEYELIKKMIQDSKMDDFIFTPGFVDDPRPFMKSTDIVVLPSRIEGLPIVLLESMSMGIPVIASDIGGIPSVITNGLNGYVCGSENIEEFTESIKNLYMNRALLNKMKAETRDYALKNFNEEKMLADYYHSFFVK